MSEKTRRLATAGIFTAVMFILSYLESLLPAFFGVPGIKPGLANIPVMVALYILDWKLAAAMSIVRVLLSGMTFSGMFACIYSLAGAVLSLLVMVIIKKTKKFSVVGMSVTGGVAHNLGQIIVACIMLGKSVMYYFPVLVVSGICAGILTGVVAGLVIKRIKGSIK